MKYYFLSFLIGCLTTYANTFPLMDEGFHALVQQEQNVDKTVITDLLDEGYVERQGEDAQLRPSFVLCQAAIEQVLAQYLQTGDVTTLIGAIHTPMPATPLCTEGDIIDLTTKELAGDPSRIKTIQKRVNTVRNMLAFGGKLLVVYPKEGLSSRSVIQQEVYQKTLSTFEKSLIDCPIDYPLPDDLIGATYLFQGKNDRWYVFSIQATQANDARDQMVWRIWFGDLSDPRCNLRFNQIDQFIEKGSPLSFSQLVK